MATVPDFCVSFLGFGGATVSSFIRERINLRYCVDRPKNNGKKDFP